MVFAQEHETIIMPPQLLLDKVNEESTTSTSASAPSPKSKGLRQSRSKDSSRSQTGRWTHDEHVIFLQGLELHGKEWKKIAKMVPTRSLVQIRSHAQKYFQKVSAAKEIGTGEGVDDLQLLMDGKRMGHGGSIPPSPSGASGKKKKEGYDLQLLMDGKRMGHGSSIPPSPSGASGKKKKEGSASTLTKKLGRTVSCSSLGSTTTFQSSSSSLSLSSMVTTATSSTTSLPAQSDTRRRNTPSSSTAQRQATITDSKDENLSESDYSSENGSFTSSFMDFGSTNNNTSRLPPPLLTVSCSMSSCGDATTADDFLSLDEYDNLDSLDLLSADDLDVFMNDMYPSEDVMMNKQEGGAGGEEGWMGTLPYKPSNVLHEPCQAQQQQGACYLDCSTTTTVTSSSHHTFFPSSSARAVVEGEGQHWLCSAPAETMAHAPMIIPLQSNHGTSSSTASCSSVTSPSVGPQQVYQPQSYYLAEEGEGVEMMMMHMPSSATVNQYQQAAMVMMQQQQQQYYYQQQQQHY